MKKKLGIAAMLAVVMLAGCVPGSSSEKPSALPEDSTKTEVPADSQTVGSTEPLRVGIMPSAVGAPVQYAQENGYFEEEGLTVETVIFLSCSPINEAIAAEELDVACSGAATIFSLATGQVKLLADVAASGGMGIWVRPDNGIMTVQGEAEGLPDMYGSAETVKGQTFICSLGTASQFNVLRYLEQLGLNETDVEIVHMEFGAGAQAFNAGQGDAIATFAPYSSQVEAEGAVKCCTFEDATGTALYDRIFARNQGVETRRDDLVKFMRAVSRAMEVLGNDEEVRKEFSMRWFAEEGRTYDDATMAQEMIDRPYVTKEVLESDTYIFGEAMIGYGEFNVNIGKLEEDSIENVKNCFDASILEEATEVDVKVPAE